MKIRPSSEWLSRHPRTSFLICGLGTLILSSPLLVVMTSRTSVVISLLGATIALLGVAGLSKQESFTHPIKWPTMVVIASMIIVFLLQDMVNRIASAVLLSVVMVSLFYLAHFEASRRKLVILSTAFAILIVFSALWYYPLDLGNDSWGYLSVAAMIGKLGHAGFSNATDQYYQAFPVVSLATSSFSIVTGANLLLSLFLFPGALLMLQPILVYLVASKILKNDLAAALSSMMVMTETSVIQWYNAPIAESVAVSVLLLLLLLLLRSSLRQESQAMIVFLYLTIVALHAAVAILATIVVSFMVYRNHREDARLIPLFPSIFIGYNLLTQNFAEVVNRIQSFVLYPLGLRYPTTINYFPLNSPITYLSLGFAPACALAALLLSRSPSIREWSIIGLSTLLISFLLTSFAPWLGADRYVGLMGWIICALVGGAVLAPISNHVSRLATISPLLFMIAISTIVSPSIAPQYSLGPAYLPPTTSNDRISLSWLNQYFSHSVTLDVISAAYLGFLQGRTSSSYTIYYDSNLSSLATILPTNSGSVFLRFSDFSQTSFRRNLVANQEGLRGATRITDLVYSTGFDVIVKAP